LLIRFHRDQSGAVTAFDVPQTEPWSILEDQFHAKALIRWNALSKACAPIKK
jgi:hypothetical protein